MQSAHGLGQIFKVRVRVHYTWLVALALITAIVVTQFPEVFSLWQRIVFGLVTGLFLFVAVSLRQLAIALLAISRGMSVRRLTLFVFGGVFQSSAESTRPVLERLVAVAGLVANLLMAGVFYGIYIGFVVAGSEIVAALTQWLGFIYFMLALFHFIPGFPLDGGRLLSSYLWSATGDYFRAIRITSWIGWAVGLIFVGGGILLLALDRQWFSGLLLTLIGWVLAIAAGLSRRQAQFYEALRGLTGRDIMSQDCHFVSPQLSLSELVRNFVLVTGQRYFVVTDGTQWQGAVSIQSLKSVPRKQWGSTRVGEVMIPASQVRPAQVGQSAVSLLEQMDDLGIDEIPVLETDRVVGIITKDSLLRLARMRSEFKM
jgi:Zn-dependent protease